jgi:DNA polymerase I-like protein with 3'-5' exonuclease and polymerase domains
MVLRHAKRLAGSAGAEIHDVSLPPPGTRLWPSRAFVDNWLLTKPWLKWDSVAIDIESAGHFITIIGFTFFDAKGTLGPTVVLPFKKRGGLDYWPTWEDHLAASTLAYEIINSDSRKVFHNGVTFDVPMLQEAGFKVGGPLADTMIRAHYTYPEMKKGLQYLATAYLGYANWKKKLDERDDLEGKS